MKVFIVSLAVLSAIFFNADFSQALEAPETYTDTITEINFYPGGAKFSFKVEPYDSEGNFKAVLPGAFNADSIRLLNPEFVEGDVHVEVLNRERWIPSQLVEIKTQADELENKIAELTAKRTAFEQTLEMLDELKPEKSKPEELLTYIKDSQTLRLDTENELVTLKKEIDKEQAKLKTLKAELNSKRPQNDSSYILITGKADDDVEFTAFTNAAAWQPRYVLDLNSSSGKIDTELYVRASQKTGLDYKHGDIILHTKTPDERITTPVLNPLKVGIKPKEEKIATLGTASFARNNMMYKSARMAGSERMVMADEDIMAEEADYEAAPMAPAPMIQESLADRTIDAEGALPGDGSERDLELFIGDIKLQGDLLIMMIPEQRNNAWLIAKMNESSDKLIPAMAELRVDGATTGKIRIGEYETQKEIPFGYADAITVKKTALVEKTGVSWFSGGFNSGYKLEITNGTKEERVITVKDRLPIPTDEKIKLEVNKIQPKEKERDAENRLTWEITVPAGATMPIIVDYKLSYPSGEELLYR